MNHDYNELAYLLSMVTITSKNMMAFILRMFAPHVDAPGPVKPVIPDRPGKVVHALKLLQGICIVYVVFLAIFVKWLKPGFLSLFSSILLGVALGIGYSFLHQFYRKRQADLNALVSWRPRE